MSDTPTADLTIAIPIGPGYEAFVERAIESVKSQTVKVEGIHFYDKDGKGAGFARNQLSIRCKTPYITFLDADDWLEPDFAEIMLGAQKKETGGRYLYSGWYEHNGHSIISREPPPKCYCFEGPIGWVGTAAHLVTVVLPVLWVKQVGGFDESLPGMEDTDFFMKLNQAGHCGMGVSKPLIHYNYGGVRSLEFFNNPEHDRIKTEIEHRYRKLDMSCCGRSAVSQNQPAGDRLPTDVLTLVHGAAFVVYVGRGSGRKYPPGLGEGMLCWADPRDVQNDPNRFQLIPRDQWPPLSTATEVGAVMNANRQNVHVPQSEARPPITADELRRLAGFDEDSDKWEA